MNVKSRRRGHRCHEVIDAMGLVRVKLDPSSNGIRLKRAGGELPQGPQGVVFVHIPHSAENLPTHGLGDVEIMEEWRERK